MADTHSPTRGGTRSEADDHHSTAEPNERTSLLNDGYLDPDDPAVCIHFNRLIKLLTV
jgi:hypothetical protein